VLDLHRQNVPLREIARRLGLHRGTVRTYVRAASFPERAHRRYPRETDRFLEYLRQRWQAGCHNAAALAAELREQGFRGSDQMVRRCVADWRQQGPAGSSSDAPPAKLSRPSSKRIAWVMLKLEAERDTEEQLWAEAIATHCPAVYEASLLAQRFVTLLREKKDGALEPWLQDASCAHSADEMQHFAQGVKDDLPAVRAAILTTWSNGQTEGQVNRLKLIKRLMFGRGKFDLLRRRVLAFAA